MGVNPAQFVIEKRGRLSDHYTIGPVLGSGNFICKIKFISPFYFFIFKTHYWFKLTLSTSFIVSLGAFGEVRRCVHKLSGAVRAVKVLTKEFIDEEDKERFYAEIEILKRMV